MIHYSFVLIKPDGCDRNLVGVILQSLESAGFNLVDIRLDRLTKEKLGKLYPHHKDTEHWPRIVDTMTSGHCVGVFVNGSVPARKHCLMLRRRLVGVDCIGNSAKNVLHCSEKDQGIKEHDIFMGFS